MVLMPERRSLRTAALIEARTGTTALLTLALVAAVGGRREDEGEEDE